MNDVPSAVSAAPAPGAGLDRSLRSRHVTMIAIGGIIGAGLFVGSSTSILTVGPAVIVSYALAGFLVLLVMRMLSELAMRFPGGGSFTELIRAGLGDLAGFVSGWLYLYFWIVVVAVEAIAGAVILADWMPAPVWLIGVVLLALMTAVNLLATRAYGEFEFWLSSLKVAAIVVFILLGVLWITGLLPQARGGTTSNLIAAGGFAPHGWGAVLAGVTSGLYTLIFTLNLLYQVKVVGLSPLLRFMRYPPSRRRPWHASARASPCASCSSTSVRSR